MRAHFAYSHKVSETFVNENGVSFQVGFPAHTVSQKMLTYFSFKGCSIDQKTKIRIISENYSENFILVEELE